MHHEVIPRPYKFCDWMLNTTWDHFSLHQGKIGQNDHEVQGPQNTYLKAYIIHWHGPMGLAVGEAKEVLK